MSQFRIKHIDQGLVDEFIPRLNNDGIQLGDDVDARDPNELSEAIIDTQEILLKTSVLSPNSILSPTSGLAERLTLLEQVAGQATLQDIYENGNTISVQNGRPLIFGSGEAIKLDENSNLSFRPATMRVRGSGASYLDINNAKLVSMLGDLLLGTVSPGNNLVVSSSGTFSLKDTYLANAITLSESGETSLETTSQSLVGAINELKNSSFLTTFQSVYAQSSPPKIITSLAQGAFQIEDPNAASIADAFRVTGNASITKRLSVGNINIGSTFTYSDANGLNATTRIRTTVEVETPRVNANLNDLTLQDKRLSLTLTDASATSLNTTSNSLVGALNELKQSIDNIGGSTIVFEEEHDPITGFHKIITTQAEVGNNAAKRFIVKDQLGVEKLSINGNGHLIATTANIDGKNVGTLLDNLLTHLSDDGTSHSAVANHLSASNPHNNVSAINSLKNNVVITSPDGSIVVSTSGNNINLSANDLSTLQSVYNNSTNKRIDLNATGLTFRDGTSTQILAILRNLNILLNRNIYFDFSGAQIQAVDNLSLQSQSLMSFVSQTEDITLNTTTASKSIILQNIKFDDVTNKTLPYLGGDSVLGNLKQLDNDKAIMLTNNWEIPLLKGQIVTFDSNNNIWFPIPSLHEANEFVDGVDFYFSNLSNLYFAAENIAEGATGKFQKLGMMTANLFWNGWTPHSDLYLSDRGYSDISITNYASIANGDQIVFLPGDLNKAIEVTTGVPNESAGIFLKENTGNTNIDTDKTIENMIRTLNNKTWQEMNNDYFYLRASIDGEYARATIKIDGVISPSENITITPHASMDGSTVVFTAVAEGVSPGYLEFNVGNSEEEAAYNLAEVINKTRFFSDQAQTLEGHLCKAEVIGSSVRLTWWKPGLSAREISLTTSGANIICFPFTGGSVKARVYRQEIENQPLGVQSSNPSAFSSTQISADTDSAPFLPEDLALGKNVAKNKNFKPVKVASIEETSGPIVRFRIK